MEFRVIKFCFLATLLFQRCAVYYKTPVALSEAVNKGKVKHLDRAGNTSRYDQIILLDSVYCGVHNGIQFQLPDQEAQVFLKDSKKSRDRSHGLGALSVGVGFLLYSILNFDCEDCL